MTNEPITFETLCHTLDEVTILPNKTEAYARCPWCGKLPHDESGRLARHFHFGQFGKYEYGKCFVCGESGGYLSIYRRATGEWVNHKPRRQQPEAPPKEPEQPPLWKECIDHLMEIYRDHATKLASWRSYKPIELNTIEEYQLGVGILPYIITHKPTGNKYEVCSWGIIDYLVRSQKTGVTRVLTHDELQALYCQCVNSYRRIPQHEERLIVPLHDEHGQLVGLRGRSMDPAEKRYKWMSSAGSQTPIFGVEYVKENDTVVLCENFVDAAMVSQMGATWRGVALGTARTIRPEEVERLQQRQPGMVLVMLDNDLAGQATGATRKRLKEEYEAKHNRPAPMPLYGYKCLEALRTAGVMTALFDWEQCNAPEKAGVDWALMQDIAEENS